MRSRHLTVTIDLAVIRAAAEGIAAAVGVPLYAVVKADAYGLGAARVAPALAGVVAAFATFSLAEAETAGLWRRTRRPVLALGPPDRAAVGDWRRAHVRPSVGTIDQARVFAALRPALCVDSGMQRFGCSGDEVDALIAAGAGGEAWTHAVRPAQARALVAACAGRGLRLHAAASDLLGVAASRLDAVRPGLALYQGAVAVRTRLHEARDSDGPVGYGGFRCRRHGVILAGYAHGLRPGWCLIGGRRRRLRECGMQSAYVEIGSDDHSGDPVTLLGDGLDLDRVASARGETPHQALLALAGSGVRRYVG